jgi:predicted amidophosphoribosyltransferase
VNTNLHEYLRPEIRGQPLCQTCYQLHFHNLIVTCPSCQQAVKDTYDVKRCTHCYRSTCPSCGVPIPKGGMLCGPCYEERENEGRASEAADALFQDALRSIY